LRSILVKFVIPVLLAVSMLALFGVPFLDRLLAEWFRSDINLRATLVSKSMELPIERNLVDHDMDSLRSYLAGITADERLLAVMICDENYQNVFRTTLMPEPVTCESEKKLLPGTNETIQLPSGTVQVSMFRTPGIIARPALIFIVHDLSYVDRRQSTLRNYALAVAGVLATVLALLAGFLFWLLLRSWVRMLVGDIRTKRFFGDGKSGVDSLPILRQIRQVLSEVEHVQRLEIDFHENWTPNALQQVVREHLHSPEMFVVSNREPYIHNKGPNGPVVQVPASGMVTALEPIVRACAGTWVAHGSGSADREAVDRYDHVRVPPENPSYTLRRVWLSNEEEQGFYYGFSNEGLWPLCHLVYVRPEFREEDWLYYKTVNLKFAEVLAQESQAKDPVILVQDYHFALLPLLLRQKKPKATIALFWHIPWPNAETFGVCPWKEEMLQHMLAADILGFHTRFHCQNFLATVDRYVECQIDHEHMTVTLRGHVCRVAPYPISIEWPPRWLASLPDVALLKQEVRQRFGIGPGVCLGLGVERWDFTKGIVERFKALETLLDKDPKTRGTVTLLQIAAPSRSKLPAYHELQERTLAEVKRINEKFATPTWKPIVFVDHHQEPQEVFKLFRAADFCIVNSLHDGMNLVAKEFISARDDLDGILILSTFAGASRELPEALLINPFDVGETAAAIKQAMLMPREERLERMKLMRRTVEENNVYRWAGRMLMDAAQIRQRQTLSPKRHKV
jgi:trehalose 6-phosphate synthase